MKKTLFITLFLAAICIMPSCVKDSAKDKVVFGNSKGMYITSYEGTLFPVQYGHWSWGNTIDLDGDGQHDVQFHSTSEVMGGDILTDFYCNENTALLGEVNDQKFSLSAYNADDSFSKDNTFMSTNVTLLNNDSNFFPMNEAKYIGFKLTENDQSRLGWMKVILHHDYVELMETAIQK